jgi:adenylate cyclase
MAEGRVQRRLAAILAADVAGYSQLMGEDEEGTLAALTAHLTELIEPCIAEHQGRVVKTTGDGLLAEFASVVDAVRCAVAFQEGMGERNTDAPGDRRIEFRIGVNLGDIIVQNDDVYGDGVNVAARLEGLAEPGNVVVSGKVHEEVRTKLDISFDDIGLQEVKNIADPVHAYRVALDAPTDNSSLPTHTEALFRLPSIAVLPFVNMSGDQEQEYFSDGVSEDLITALSRIRLFRVVSRSSTFAYKDKSPDAREVAKELDAGYVVEGSVRKAGNRVRLTAQLIDGATGSHLWAERYDRKLEDIFDVQDELTETVIGSVAPSVRRAEQQRSRQKSPEGLDAWDLYQRGMWHHYQSTKEHNAEARTLLKRAIEADPQFGPAYSGYVWSCMLNTLFGFEEGYSGHAKIAAQKAIELDHEDATAHHALGAIYYINRDHDDAILQFQRAISLDPSFASAYHFLGMALVNSGRAREALAPVHTAIRLSPRDDFIGPFHARLAVAHLYLREHDQAVEWARKAMSLGSIPWPCHVYLTSALAHLGCEEDAKRALNGLLEVRPGTTQDFVRQHLTTTNWDDLDHLIDGLCKAGLTEN